jgi:hypothetical protein
MIFIFCVFLPIYIIANPINEHSLEHTIEKRTALPEEIHSKVFVAESSVEPMLQAFQAAVHLPITKKLGTTALNLMDTPRCSVPDSPSSSTNTSKLW